MAPPPSPYAMLDRGQSRKASGIPAGDVLHSAMARKTEAPPYDDLINYPRAKDKDEIRCVMCGLPPGSCCVIPRQNKDVCKECDKSTWQHIATNVYFKWCKGCKKFLRLGSFSEKLDAAKCDRCRERGRQSYLLKKGKDGSSSVGNRSRSNSINSMKSDFDDLSETLDLAAAAAAMAAVGRSTPASSCQVGDSVVSSSGDEAEERDGPAFRSSEAAARYSRHAAAQSLSRMNLDLADEESMGSGEEDFRTPPAKRGRMEDLDAAACPVVIDDDSADITKSKLSSVFGMPLSQLSRQKPYDVEPSPSEGSGGVDEDLGSTRSSTSKRRQGVPVSAALGGTLYELACIHQRIMTLEEHAERVKHLEATVKSQEEEILRLKDHGTVLEDQLQTSRLREETSHEEAEKLRAECARLRDVQSNFEKKEANLTQKLSEADALSALTNAMERVHKRPRLVSLGE
mmetsp:Transcript_24176/g.70962  ORF Transcript_24176/g.70962 Transcript_24176/m.70962 type:complete len:457 (-) Transcript_24176:110-1480(-)|eukprot:CAMPEP_0118998402 /NCGR_PEP_ID=MMETSP1173-20130426/63057_1 /TAXON_ID=1034831 /ORGANISM="Rhizochromulina marina cf, Strain CCMP1243" /LENGTH=456 /DNA_ID=CAMNT_0006949895 /DNA_START=72 /DNA_END=1442 /DNA_ORIENTATION=-